MKNTTVNTLQQYKINQEKFSCITSYDAIFTRHVNLAGIDTILVGDSLGMVLQGHDSTIPVTIDDMCYHVQSVARGNSRCLIIADMPFMSYSDTPTAVKNATALMQAGAHMVKIEGGQWLCPTISTLVCGGIPVCAHIGLTPQTVNILGGYKVQGRNAQQAEQLLNDAQALEKAGAQLLVMECVPSQVAANVDKALHIPTIGIGAGPDTTGQVLVIHDMLGLNPQPAKFVKNFMQDATSIPEALANYHNAVRSGAFPQPEHGFN